MNESNEQERPATIDSKGNIIPKPYGPSRWDNPRIRQCAHKECTKPALILRLRDSIYHAHNCCIGHDEEGLDS